MGWRVFGQRFETADFSGAPVYSQKLTPAESTYLLAIRTWFICYNDPSFTSIALRIYANHSGSLGPLLHTSDSRTKSEIIALDNGIKEVYFTFNASKGVSLRADDSYFIVPWVTGYTGDETSHLAWMKDFPDPINDVDISLTYPKLGVAPFRMSLIGGDP